jgi:integrase
MAKRANGEGTIYRRRDGRWAATVSLDNGRRKTYYGKTRREAAAKLHAAIDKRRSGLPLASERQTTGAFLTSWLEAIRPRVRESTYRGYECKVRVQLLPALGHIPLARLTPQAVEAALAQRIAAGLAPRTAYHLRAILRAALSDAMRWGLVGRNVAALVEAPRVPQSDVPPLGIDEARRVLDAMRGDRLEALYSVALAMGLRQGEALALRWDDVDFDAATLTVSGSLVRAASGGLVRSETKTARSRRTLAMPDAVTAALRAHRARQLQERLTAGNLWHDTGLVFTRPDGRPLYGANVTRAFQQRLAAAGLRRLRFHDLRHACATLLLAQGVGPRVVMDVLGHSNISLTMNLYAHVLPESRRLAAATMDALLASGS